MAGIIPNDSMSGRQNDESRAALAASLRRSAESAQSFAVFLMAIATLGWLLGLDALVSVLPGWPGIHPVMIGFIVGGAATMRLLAAGTRRARLAAYVVGSGTLLMAVLLGGLQLSSAHTLSGDVPIYSIVTTATLLVAIACSFWDTARGRYATRAFGALASILALIGLVGVTYRLLLHMPALVELSLLGGVALLALSYAIIVGRQDEALLAVLTDPRPGAIILRRSLPVIVLLPILIGLVRMVAQRAGWMDSAAGGLFLTVITVAGMAAFILWLARVLNDLDAERKAAERIAEHQREWLRVTLGSINDAVIATDPDMVVRVVNPAAALLLRQSVESLTDASLEGRIVLCDDNGEPVESPLRAMFNGESGTASYRDLNLRIAEGVSLPVEIGVAPIRDVHGTVLGGVMVMRDVSERRKYVQVLRDAYAELDRRVAERTSALQQANAALHETLALFRGVAESTPDLIFVKDLQGAMVMANPATCRLFGRPEAELIGNTMDQLLDDPALVRSVHEHDQRVLASGRVERIEQMLRSAEGYRTYLATKSPLRDVDGKIVGLISVETDITDRKRMENELREAQRFTQGLLDTAPLVLYLLDLDQGRFVFASGMVMHALGYEAEALRGMNTHGLLRRVHPDDRHNLLAHLRAYTDDTEGLRTTELRFRHHDGDWRWLHCRERLLDPAASTRLVLGVAIDVTDRREAERELEQLIEAEKRLRHEAERANRAKDEFLAVVSHELRSPLNALRGWSFLLGNSNPVDPDLLDRAVQAIKRNVDHQARLIDDLLDTSRIMSGKLNLEHRPVNLIETVNSALELVRPAIAAKRINLDFTHVQASLTIDGDPARLHQVVVNLLSNAVKFTPEEGRIDLEAAVVDGRVRVTVRDSGAGIEPEFLPRVFERFSQADASTTRKHGGLGIGLALVRHLIELHGGTVSAFSEGVGKGAMFVIDLPLPSARAALDNLPAAGAGAAKDAPLAGVDVCALDDDPDARDIIAVALRRAGATVRSAASGAELIAMLDADLPAKRPDVMLLDLAMPGEDGFGVLAKVRALEQRKGLSIDDAIPAIAVTAFAELSRVRIVEAGFIERVAKPFDPGALVSTIMRVLGNRAARAGGGALRARA